MKILLLIIFFAICEAIGTRSKRLARGDCTAITLVPYYASLRYNDQHICGGALITKRHVLTAAHCVANLFDEPYEELTVVTGTDNLYYGGSDNFVQHIDWPKEAERSELYDVWIHDIAVVTLTQSIETNKQQMPVQMASNDPAMNITALISGFGRTDIENPYLSEKLRVIRSRILPREACQKFMNYKLHENNICGLQKSGSRVCKGDSGGPVVHDGKLVGIVSWYFPEACNYPDVYTNVNRYLKFINGIVNTAELKMNAT